MDLNPQVRLAILKRRRPDGLRLLTLEATSPVAEAPSAISICMASGAAARLEWPWVSEVIVLVRLDPIMRAELAIPFDAASVHPQRVPTLLFTDLRGGLAAAPRHINPLRLRVSPSATPQEAAILRALARLAAVAWLPWRAHTQGLINGH